ncbi:MULTISPECIES: DUF2752 domain-containing protein [Myroides]|uniref:DUF2752 domain-containing protein n=1 Tax=Myroides albus TaxID=2562892 RepID=A0A6I3LMR3_9FLAO|nr:MULTISPECIES: DUF2752 domain-containing protein [Myroides]MTG99007.1 DUF2752 domain-containing protein [Myroides albus]MVX35560.1 DUF2752 domain-containing protein [Myroides sp. LoEW2-1]UVD80330.1 DUF2752 domain-containing protein [Myroides albus]
MIKIGLRFVFYSLPLVVLYYYLQYFGTDNNEGVGCYIYDTSGWLCPGCGGQRALHSILQGHLLEAFHFNQLIYIYIPLIAILYIAFVETFVLKNKRIRNYIHFPRWFSVFLIVLIAAFTIYRNWNR